MSDLTSAFVVLLLVIDPLGNIPFFLASLQTVPPARRSRVILREVAIAAGLLTFFLIGGRHFLALLGVGPSSLGIAGGLVLFLIAIKMIFSGSEAVFENTPAGEPLVVPLAVPLLAGPSSVSTVILLSARDPLRWIEWLAVLYAAVVVSAGVLLLGARLLRVLGRQGLVAAERLTGMVLTAVAVEMVLKAWREGALAGAAGFGG